MNSIFQIRALCTALLAVALPFGNGWAQIYLGDAQGFNATVFGDFEATQADTEGRLAIGGNAILPGGYSVGEAAPSGLVGIQNPKSYNDTRDDLVIQGNASLTGTYVAVHWGSVKVGGSISGGNFGTDIDVTGNTVQSNVPNFAQNVFDFNATENLIRSYTNQWSTLSSNGSIDQVTNSLLRLTGTSNQLNIFNVSASQWSASGVHQFIVPEGSTVLVNISGDDISVVNGGMQFWNEDITEDLGGGNFRGHVLINAYEATEVSTESYSWEGSFFAPDAHLSGDAGAINGQAFLGSVYQTGGFEFHNFFLEAQYIVIPEMGTLLLVLIPLSLTLGMKLRRKKG